MAHFKSMESWLKYTKCTGTEALLWELHASKAEAVAVKHSSRQGLAHFKTFESWHEYKKKQAQASPAKAVAVKHSSELHSSTTRLGTLQKLRELAPVYSGRPMERHVSSLQLIPPTVTKYACMHLQGAVKRLKLAKVCVCNASATCASGY